MITFVITLMLLSILFYFKDIFNSPIYYTEALQL